jgi:pyruvate dehydrogenase E2 component (dihydrolipoamide acetyltransferase)
MSTFALPDLGEGLQEAEVVTWHVGPGDHVVAGQPLVSVETDKAVVEIPAPSAGRVVSLHAAAGDVLPTGAPLVDLAPLDADTDRGTVVGELGDGAPLPSAAASPGRAAPLPGPHVRAHGAVKAAPAVRARAAGLGVDLARVPARGPGGSVTLADLNAFARGQSGNAMPVAFTGGEPLRGPRRVMAQRMAEAHAQVVPATLTELADVQAWENGADITLRLVRAVCRACAAEPSLNAWLSPDGTRRKLHGQVHLGLAMDTADGLFVPVLRDAGSLAPAALRDAVAGIKAAVRDRSVAPGSLRGASITLSNFGMLAGLHATLVVVPPQVAIVGAGRVHEHAMALHGQCRVHRCLPLSLSFDHRAVVGAEAARFMAAMVDDLTAAS